MSIFTDGRSFAGRLAGAAALLVCVPTIGDARAATAPAAIEPTDTTGTKGEAGRPPVKPAPGESKTPEEASRRAADPKDPSGALIIAPPAGEGSKGR